MRNKNHNSSMNQRWSNNPQDFGRSNGTRGYEAQRPWNDTDDSDFSANQSYGKNYGAREEYLSDDTPYSRQSRMGMGHQDQRFAGNESFTGESSRWNNGSLDRDSLDRAQLSRGQRLGRRTQASERSFGATRSMNSGYGSTYGNDSYRSNGSDLYSSYDRNMSGTAGQQSFRGKGPKGYTRTDDRIKDDVCEQLMDDSSVDAENIEVSVKSGIVTLSGTVTNKEDKYLAEDIAESALGVQGVDNMIRVNREVSSARRADFKESDTKGSKSSSSLS